jgi:membrane protease YdiL (CAAX protease family)
MQSRNARSSHPASGSTAPADARRGGPAQAWRLVAALPLLAAAALVPAPLWTSLLFAPIAEEVVFRAGLQESLLRRLGARHAVDAFTANLLTALAFAAAHVALRPGILACLTILPSLLVGRVYQQHRRLELCVALHAGFNLIWLLCAGVSF